MYLIMLIQMYQEIKEELNKNKSCMPIYLPIYPIFLHKTAIVATIASKP
jgi:hypothetical protein